ncbi:uracil-DNA glycosylase [Shimia ponticola]|uniref:uracil-DNA glycosylase n=1 Tax=Shimia ponticola TaxID=2582893 RepID=UPI003D28F7BE
MDWHIARAALDWQVELGATEAIGDVPVNRYEVEAEARAAKAAAPAAMKSVPPIPAQEPEIDAVAEATRLAATAPSLEALADAQASFDHCDLKKGARNFVFADGVAGAPLMIVGEAPGRDEDREGKPFVGRAGQLLDRMLAAIDMTRAQNVYITNVLPWRPPQNRDPKPDEMAMMLPFVKRHIELAQPKVLIAMGNHSCQALLQKRGITRLRGQWHEALGLPVIPMLHPAYLLRQPHAKRGAWEDLLSLKSKLRDLDG